ncbi:MAG: hypothetical protein O2807_00705, partial [bacterium]|nr:hypothetical protein [bacterium]
MRKKTCALSLFFILLGLGLLAGCGRRTAQRGAAFDPAAAPLQASLPKPFLRLPQVTFPGEDTLLLTWDTEPGTSPMWVHLKSAGDSARRIRMDGRPVKGDPAGRLRYRVQVRNVPGNASVAYGLCRKENCPAEEFLFANEIPPQSAASLSLMVLGGLGRNTPGQFAVAKLAETIRSGRPPQDAPKGAQMAVFLGDLLPSGASTKMEDSLFFRVYGRLLSSTPFYAVLGPDDLLPGCGRAFTRRFGLPGRYFAVRRGEALFIFLDSNEGVDYEYAARKTPDKCPGLCEGISCVKSDLRLSDHKQIAWLIQTLIRDKSKWRFVFMHHPLFSGGNRKGYGSAVGRASARALQEKVFRIFRTHRVDLVFSSGDPIYERSIHVVDTNPAAGSISVAGGEFEK